MSNGHLAEGQENWKEIKDADRILATIIHSTNPTVLLSLREINDLSCVVLPGFLMGTPLIISPLSYDQLQTKVVS